MTPLSRRLLVPAAILAAASLAASSMPASNAPRTLKLDSTEGLELHHVKAVMTDHLGRKAVRLVERTEKDPGPAEPPGHAIAILPGSDFKDGVIETEIAGEPMAGAPDGSRGFVGIAFRVREKGAKFECFYIRPTNGRANDQLRRNHATQYISHPNFPWYKLREENPGVYESYADVVPGAWTKIRIEVSGEKARLFVNGADQPSLIVNDLKLGVSGGAIALWIGQGTEAWFTDVTVR